MNFEPFPKLSRLSRECIITEKIDGTNAQIYICANPPLDTTASIACYNDLFIFAGSRSKYLTVKDDNFGFARWVEANAEELIQLGPGRHFGEWWGSGIQIGYGLPKGEKRFSLFNVSKWMEIRPSCCHVVPIIKAGIFSDTLINEALEDLKSHGSYAAPFMNPEGIVIYHTAANMMFKKTIEDDEKPKGSRE